MSATHPNRLQPAQHSVTTKSKLPDIYKGEAPFALINPIAGWCALACGSQTFYGISYTNDAIAILLDFFTRAAYGRPFATEFDREGRDPLVMAVTKDGTIVVTDGTQTVLDFFADTAQAAEYGLAFAKSVRENINDWLEHFFLDTEYTSEDFLADEIEPCERKMRRAMLDITEIDLFEEATLTYGDETIVDGYVLDDGVEGEVTFSASIKTNVANIEVEAETADVESVLGIFPKDDPNEFDQPPLWQHRQKKRTYVHEFTGPEVGEFADELTDILAEIDVTDETLRATLEEDVAEAVTNLCGWCHDGISVDVTPYNRA